MLNWFKFHKSAGQRVSASVYRLIRQGNQARDTASWPEAAKYYASATAADPSLGHIWVQLGHAQTEIGHFLDAATSYRRATGFARTAAEAHLFLARNFRKQGEHLTALRHFISAAVMDDAPPEAPGEMLHFLAHMPNALRAEIRSITRTEISSLPLDARSNPVARALDEALDQIDRPSDTQRPYEPTGGVVFDASDLIDYYQNARLPTGIQRVQIQTIRAVDDAQIACFIAGRDDWLSIPTNWFEELAFASLNGHDRQEIAWRHALLRLRLLLALSDPFELPRQTTLINLGTSWWLRNYFLLIRHAKITRQIRYVPFVYDMIPIRIPEHCIDSLTDDFMEWAMGVFDHADAFIACSEATRRDLIDVAATLGFDIDSGLVGVAPLDVDFRIPAISMPTRSLQDLGIGGERFALFVSTVESRKGHAFAFDAWQQLIAEHGASNVPLLVCVGNRGWKNEHVYQRLEADERLAERVRMLSGLTDSELSMLYQSCQFTLYPSLYEGWGLPVTESLCHGKVPVISTAASLPEAGGRFAIYFEPASIRSIVNAVDDIIRNPQKLALREAEIARDFRPRPWSEFARKVVTASTRLRQDAPAVSMPPHEASSGIWYSLARHRNAGIAPAPRSGEIFRSGLGWDWPEYDGCRLKAGEVALRVGTKALKGNFQLHLKLIGAQIRTSAWELSIAGVGQCGGVLPPHEEQWACMDFDADQFANIDIAIRTDAISHDRNDNLGIEGMVLLPKDDAESISAFIRG